jgi:hypothetical protein
MMYKSKVATVFTFLVGFYCSAYAYTREDVETMRSASAFVSMLIDVCIAGADISDQSHFSRGPLVALEQQGVLQSLRSCPQRINAVLSAALEKDESILCLQLLTILAWSCKKRLIDSDAAHEQKVLKKFLEPLVPKIINTILFASLKQMLPGPKCATIRRVLRILIATATRTASLVVLDRLIPAPWDIAIGFGGGQLKGAITQPKNWSCDEIIFQACINLLNATVNEVLGAVVAAGIQEIKQ